MMRRKYSQLLTGNLGLLPLTGFFILLVFFNLESWAKTMTTKILTEKMINPLEWRQIGPSLFSGRIADIAVPKGQSRTIYCAAASGGIWKTTNRGTTWEPIFDDQGTGSMGAIAVSDSDPDIIWAGTGEPIAASHTTWGDGVYRSTDAGKTWDHMGLKETQQIGAVIINPDNPDIVYIAAAGHLWGENSERGLYKTTDGGTTWEKSLFINEKVGIVDAVMDPAYSQTLYAAAYGRMRGRYSRSEAEEVEILEGSGIYKTTDAGQNWINLTEGLPIKRVGRIGLAVSSTNPKKIYALVERAPYELHLNMADIHQIKDFLSTQGDIDPTESDHWREFIVKRIPEDEMLSAVVSGLDQAENIQLRNNLGLEELDTGGGVFCSENKGETWRRVNKMSALRRPSYYSHIYVHPLDENTLYIPEVRMNFSSDGGKTFEQAGWAFSSWLTSKFIHGDFHPLWINPEDPAHMIVGTDGGLYSSYDGGKNWEAHFMPIGQFHTIAVDMRKPYYIYGGMEDNGSWAGPSATRHFSGITNHDWFKFEHSDGAYIQIDPTDNMTVYSEWQNGNIRRLDLRTGMRTEIKPSAETGDSSLRFNFITPFVLSCHDSNALYLGTQKVLKTTNRGDSWVAISPDLTRDKRTATISTIAESPIKQGLIFAGTEDGIVQLSQDDGATWKDVTANFPSLPHDKNGFPTLCVSRLEASHFDPGTAYASFDGHRKDNYRTYIYRTNDLGKTWKSIKGDLPDDLVVRVIREDPKNPSLLFTGTDKGVFCSINGGTHWVALANGLPPVRVDDMVIHPRDADLVIGTHGRGLFTMDISPLQQITQDVLNMAVYLFNIQPAILYHLDITKNKGVRGARWFTAKNPYAEASDLLTIRYVLGENGALAPPGAAIYYYLEEKSQVPVEINVCDSKGAQILRKLKGPAEKGLNYVIWDLRKASSSLAPTDGGNDAVRLRESGLDERPGSLVIPGKYLIVLIIDGNRFEQKLIVKPDDSLRF
jgi:photosystem II stability/assembly factor-like uncharacterized protein